MNRRPLRRFWPIERVNSMKIALGQFNPCLGDFAGNIASMQKLYIEARKANVDLLVFPEMAICGYPPEDLLLKKHFLEENHRAVEQLAANCPEKTIYPL